VLQAEVIVEGGGMVFLDYEAICRWCNAFAFWLGGLSEVPLATILLKGHLEKRISLRVGEVKVDCLLILWEVVLEWDLLVGGTIPWGEEGLWKG
jgi:hypothetical protein